MRVLFGLVTVAVALILPAAAQASQDATVALDTVNGVDIIRITSDARGSDVRVAYLTSGCGAAGDPCDEFYANSGTVTNGGGCDQQGITIVRCPDRAAFVAALGDGSDSLVFDNIGYDAVVASGGGGEDFLQGATSCTSTQDCATILQGDGGNDVVIGGPGPDEIHGGDGADELHGRAGNDQLYGEGGNDQVLEGEAGNDLVDGGAGDDLLGGTSSAGGSEPGVGADAWVGGPGNDLLTFDEHTGGVNISLDGQPNDGSPGEGDNVGDDIERIIGSRAGDTFTGSAHADRFDGGPGNDTISGGDGADTLNGDTGNDTVNGDAGDDTAAGGADDDTVDGGPGADFLQGDTANCSVLSCPAGNDLIRARDGTRDVIGCGLLADTVIADAIDLTDGECETVDRAAVGPGPPTDTLRGTTLSAAALKAKKGVVPVKLTNPNAYAVNVALTLKQGKKSAGSGRATLGANATGTANVKLSKTALKTLRKTKRLNLKLTLATTGPSGTTPSTATVNVTVK